MTDLEGLLKQVAEQKSRAFDAAFAEAPDHTNVELMAGHVCGLLKAAMTLGLFATAGRFTEAEWRVICTATWAGEYADALATYAIVVANAKEKA